MTETAPAVESRVSLWRNRTFLSIWLGHTISIIGDGFHSVALALWVLQTTGSGTAMATIMTVRVLAGILLGAVAGTYVDRTDRRRVMIITDVLRFVLVLGLAGLVVRPGTGLPVIVLLSGVISVCGQFFNPAMTASLVNIVGKEQVSQASGMLQMTNTLAQVAGPFIGGTVVALFGGWAALVGDAFSFLVSAGLILLGGAFASPVVQKEQRSFWGDMKDGLGFIRRHSLARGVVALAPAINFFGNALGGVLLPVILVKVWRASSFQFGLAEAAFPLGFALGAGLFMAFSAKLRRKGLWMFGTILAASAIFTVIPMMHSALQAIPLYVLAGILNAFPNVLFQVTLQAEIPTEVQGRVFGTMGSLLSAASPLAFLVAGPMGDLFSPVRVAVAFGIGLLVTSTAGFLALPGLRNYNG